jgi:uncharacterized repeat protein (TIGR02543 family)
MRIFKFRMTASALIAILVLAVSLALLGCEQPTSSGKKDDPNPDPAPAAGTYTVTFDKNGGDTEANPKTKSVKEPATTIDALPAAPTRASYSFTGWNTADGSGTAFEAATEVKADITVFAQWKTYTITYVTNPPSGSSTYNFNGAVPATQNGVTIIFPATPPSHLINTYLFVGWYKDEACTNRAIKGTPISADTTLYAKWFLASLGKIVTLEDRPVADNYSPDPVYTGDKYIPVENDKPFSANALGVALDDLVPTRGEEWRFDGWFTASDDKLTDDSTFSEGEDTFYYAKWYDLIANPDSDQGTWHVYQQDTTGPEITEIKTDGTANSLTISWKAAIAPGVQKYEIWMGTDTNIDGGMLNAGRAVLVADNIPATARSATVTRPADDVTYNFWVKAVRNATAIHRNTGTQGKFLNTVQGAYVSLQTSSSFTVSWPPVKGAESYDVYCHTYTDFSSSLQPVNVSTETFEVDDISNTNLVYYMWIVAKNSYGNSGRTTKATISGYAQRTLTGITMLSASENEPAAAELTAGYPTRRAYDATNGIPDPDDFDFRGLAITASYTEGSPVPVDYSPSDSRFDVSAAWKSGTPTVPGTAFVTLTVTYTDGENTRNASGDYRVYLAKNDELFTTDNWKNIPGASVGTGQSVGSAGRPFANATNTNPVTVDTFNLHRQAVSDNVYDAVYSWANSNAYKYTRGGVNYSLNYGVWNGAKFSFNWLYYQSTGHYNWYTGEGGHLYNEAQTYRSSSAAAYPIVNTTLANTLAFCNAVSEMTGRTPVYYTDTAYTTVLRSYGHSGNIYRKNDADGYRIPLEKEWEFAARGGNPSDAYWKQYYVGTSNPSAQVDGSTTAANKTAIANYSYFNYSEIPTTTPTEGTVTYIEQYTQVTTQGTADPKLGLYQIAGNVWEYNQQDADGPVQSVVRGGSFHYTTIKRSGYAAATYPSILGIDARFPNLSGLSTREQQTVGFRLARNN